MLAGMKRSTKIIFILSLGLNLLILGSILGHRFIGKHKHKGMTYFILKQIPEVKRPEVKQILSNFREQHPHGRKRFMRQWPELEKLLRQKDFDRSAFMSVIDKQKVAHTSRIEAGGKAIADIAEILTYDERVKVLDKIKSKWKRRHHWGRKYD